MSDFKELVKNLYTSKNRELTPEKFDYIQKTYSNGKEQEFVKNFYATIGEDLTEEKLTYISDTYLKKKDTPSPLSATPSRLPKISEQVSPLQQGANIVGGGVIGDISKTVPKGSIKEAALADKKKNESYLGALWNNVVGSAARLAGGAARATYQFSGNPVIQMERELLDKAGKAIGKNLLAAKEKEYADVVKGVVERGRTSASSKEYEQKLAQGFDVTDGVGLSDLKGVGAMIPQFIADMGLAVGTGGGSFAIQGYDDALSMVDEMPKGSNISEGTRVAFGVGGALVVGALEKLGLDNLIKNPAAKKYVTAKILKEATDELVKKGVKVTADQFEKTVIDKASKLTAKELGKIVAKRGVKSGVIEGGTEAIQEGGMDLLKLAANKIEGKEIFNEEEMKDTAAKRYLNSFVAGGILGGIGGSVASRVQNTEAAIKDKLSKAKTVEDIDSIVAEINENVADGTMTEEEANDVLPIVQNFVDVSQKVPAELSGKNKVQAVDLISEREKLAEQIKKIEEDKAVLDPSFHPLYEGDVERIQERVDEINKELAELAKPENNVEEVVAEEEIQQPIELSPDLPEGYEIPIQPIEEQPELVDDKTGLILYHGSPHSFQNFDISKLGSGEGAQAFGYGLYFTNETDIARGYANKLSSRKNFWDALIEGNKISLSKEDYNFIKDELDALGFDGGKAEGADLGDVLVDGKEEYSPEVLDAMSILFGKNAAEELKGYDLTQEQIDRLMSIKKKISDPQFYKVSVHKGKSPSEYDYIDWAEPLSASQRKKIGKELPENISGQEFYKSLVNELGSDKKASEFLLSKGVDGITYKSNKGTGGKSGKGRNYVVFDSNSIEVEEINDIPQPKKEPKELVEAVRVEQEPIVGLNKDNKQPFTTKSKKQVVSFENGDLIVRDAKTGSEVSPKTKKKALREYAESFDFTVGEKAAAPTEGMQFRDENELNQYIVDNSQNPSELVEVYVNQEPTTAPLSSIERMVADYGIGKVTNKSFERFGDRNLKGISMAKTYFNNQTGQSIDQVAKEMSDHYDVEITPQDIADFMVRFPNGEGTALKLVESEVASNAAAKFKELTGLNLNQEIAQKVIEQQFNKLSKAEQLIAQQDYESATELEEAYWAAYKQTNGFTEEGNIDKPKQEEARDGGEQPKAEVGKQPIGEAESKKEDVEENVQYDNIKEPPPPKTPPTQKEGEEGDANLVALEHAATEEKRAAYGMEGRTLREVKKDEQLEAEANEAIRNGYDVKGLIKRITNKDHLPTDKEHIILLKYAAGLEKKLEGLDPKSKEFEDVFTELNATYKASEVGGSELGAAFRARQSRVLQEDALGEMLVREAEVNRVEELTPEQRENVVKEYEAIKKAKEEWEAKYNELQNQQLQKDAELEVQKAKRTSIGKKKTKEDFTKERQSIKDAIKDKWKKAANDGTLLAIPVPYAKQLAAISPDVAKLMKSYVEEGITDLGEIVSKIKEDVQDFVEGVTEKDIRDIIAGVYNEKRTKNQIASDLRDLRDEAKLLNQLEALENGEVPKTEKAKIERNQKITDLRNKIKELKKELIGGKTIDGEPIDKKLKSIKTRLEKQIQELEEKLSKGDYSKEEKKPPIKLDKEAQELKDKLIKLKQEREIRLLQQEYANRTKVQKAKDLGVEILNVPRTIMASIDFSAPLRQGIIATISYPKVSMEAFVEMFKQAVSQKRFDRWFYDLRESPEYEIMEKAGLYIADPHDPKLSAKEEQFMNNLAEKIPFVGKLIKGSERAYVSYLNKMRADLFIKGMEAFEVEGKTIKNSPELYESLASFINNATGRGKMAKTLEDGAPILNAAFFSPRLMASRINLMNPAYYANLSPEIRKMAMRDMSKFLAFGTSLLILAALAGADIEKDPRSPNFMKIKIGDTTYDIWGGFQQYIVELTQLLRGETKSASTGEIRSLSGKEFPFRTRGEDLQGFVRGKLAPVPAATMNLLTGKKVTGERTSLGKEIGGLLLPLNAKDAYQAFSEQGILGGLGTLVPATFGIGVQSMSNIPEAADAKKPEWKYISEKKVRVPQPDLETMKVEEEDREMTSKEIETFVELRTKKLESFISKILNKGLYVVNEKGIEVYKPSRDLTKEVLDEELKKASKRITAEVKEEMFGKEEEKPDKAKEKAKYKNEKLLKD